MSRGQGLYPQFEGDPELIRRREYALHLADLGEVADDDHLPEAAQSEEAIVHEDGALGRSFPRRKRPERFLRIAAEFCDTFKEGPVPEHDEARPANVAVYETSLDDPPGSVAIWAYCKIGERYVLVDVFVRIRDGRPWRSERSPVHEGSSE